MRRGFGQVGEDRVAQDRANGHKGEDSAKRRACQLIEDLLVFAGTRFCLREERVHALAALFDSSVLTDLVSKVVKLGSADVALSSDLELGYVRRMQWERALDADTTANLAEGDCLGDPTVLNGDADAFEELNSLFTGFANLNVSLHGVAGADLGKVVLPIRH
jgi:hypothetical protein